MSRYDNIIAELAERVPELAEECQPEIITFLEQCQYGSSEPLSPEDIEYLRQLQIDNPDQCRDEVRPALTYIVFENSLRRFLIELLHDPARHFRLQEILNWLEVLLGDEDKKVQTLAGHRHLRRFNFQRGRRFSSFVSISGRGNAVVVPRLLAILSGERTHSRFAPFLKTLKTGGLLQQ